MAPATCPEDSAWAFELAAVRGVVKDHAVGLENEFGLALIGRSFWNVSPHWMILKRASLETFAFLEPVSLFSRKESSVAKITVYDIPNRYAESAVLHAMDKQTSYQSPMFLIAMANK